MRKLIKTALNAVVFGVLMIKCGALAAVVGLEAQINPTFVSAPGIQDSVSIAAGPNGYFAVWQDSRGTNGTDIFGCRISPTGQILDPTGIPICVATGNQISPSVTWSGQQWVVVWADRRTASQHIYGSRVSPGGEVLDPQGILISGTSTEQNNPRVAGDGLSCLVVWQDERTTSSDIYCAKLSSDGTAGKAYGISTRTDNEQMPDVAFNGSTYLVTWCDYRNYASSDTDIYVIRVSKAGIRSGAEVLVSKSATTTSGAARSQRNPRVCNIGGSWIVAWEDYRNGADHSDIYAARVSSTAALLDKGGIAVATTLEDKILPSVAYDGNKILIVWRNGTSRRIQGARVSTGGVVLDPNSKYISSTASGKSGCIAVGFGNQFVVGWSSLDMNACETLFTLVSDGGVAQSPDGSLLSLALNNQKDYSVVDNGAEYAVVWSATVDGQQKILGARVSHSGVLLTDAPINLTQSIKGDQTQPALAWNGKKYLLVWRGNESFVSTEWDIRGLLLSANLTPISSAAIAISGGAQSEGRPDVGTNGSNFLVAWEDNRDAPTQNYTDNIYGATVSSDGVVKLIATAISSATGNQLLPRIASDGSGYMVVWEDYRTVNPTIKGSRVSSTGTVSDTTGIVFPNTSTAQTSPSICYGNGSYFVTWSDSTKITACRVSSAASIIDKNGITVSYSNRDKRCPSACWDGENYQLVWEDYRSSDSANSDIYGTSVSSAGVVSSYPDTALVTNLMPQLRPRIFASGGNGMLFYANYYYYTNFLNAVTLSEQPVQEVSTVSDAKQLPAGSLVALHGKVVTASFPGYYYVEEMNRASGIRVVSNSSPTVGSLVDLVGSLSLVDGERRIDARQEAQMGTAAKIPQPLGIRGDWLGGATLNAQTPGITGGRGLNNIGLLVITWGRVTTLGTGYFYIDCGQGAPIKVKSGSLTQPVVGNIVVITGISTCDLISGGVFRAILPRQQSDIQIIK